jgi:hypothetical protein
MVTQAQRTAICSGATSRPWAHSGSPCCNAPLGVVHWVGERLPLAPVGADRLRRACGPALCWLCVVAGLLQVSCKRFPV